MEWANSIRVWKGSSTGRRDDWKFWESAKLGGANSGKLSWQQESFSYTQGKGTKMMSMREGSVSCYQGMRKSA